MPKKSQINEYSDIEEIRRKSTCNLRVDLQTLGSQLLIMPNNLPDNRFSSLPWKLNKKTYAFVLAPLGSHVYVNFVLSDIYLVRGGFGVLPWALFLAFMEYKLDLVEEDVVLRLSV